MAQTTTSTAAEGVSLSNRRETSPFFGGSSTGVDRLSLSFQVLDWEKDLGAWGSRTSRPRLQGESADAWNGHIDGCFVGVMEIDNPHAPYWGKVEANPSRLLDPDGWETAPLGSLSLAAEKMWSAVHELMTPAGPIEDTNVKRLDLARDFSGVERPDFIIRGLGPCHRPYARQNLVHFDATRKGAQTLLVGSKSGSVRLYDKNAETEGRAPEGTLRWEVEARARWCKEYGGMAKLGDVTEERMESLALERWNWSSMGAEVSSADIVVEKVMRSGLSHAKQRGLLGWLTMKSVGVESPLSNDAASEFRRLCKQMNISAADLRPGGESYSARLDWATGTEVRSYG